MSPHIMFDAAPVPQRPLELSVMHCGVTFITGFAEIIKANHHIGGGMLFNYSEGLLDLAGL